MTQAMIARIPFAVCLLYGGVLGGFLAVAQTTAAEGAPDASKPAVTNGKAKEYEVQIVRDVAYRDLYEGEDADQGKNKLDLFLPRDLADAPVLFFVHGGAWRHGDKSFLGFYSSLAMSWARLGINVVVANYRLSPAVQHPEHIKDIAKACAWTYRNIARYGGRPQKLFVCGHSAGGHLVSLLALQENWLKGEGLSPAILKGAIPISGVYDLASFDPRLFAAVFGKDPEERRKASPLAHIHGNAPPFLVLYADNDFPMCGEVSEKFCRALKTAHCEVASLEVKDRNHITVLLCASSASDPVTDAIVRFMNAHAGLARSAEPGKASNSK